MTQGALYSTLVFLKGHYKMITHVKDKVSIYYSLKVIANVYVYNRKANRQSNRKKEKQTIKLDKNIMS